MFHVTYASAIEKDNPKIIFSIFLVNFTSSADKNYYYFIISLPDFVFACKGVYANLWFLVLLMDTSTFIVLTAGPIKLFWRFFDVSFQFKIMMLAHMVYWVSAIV